MKFTLSDVVASEESLSGPLAFALGLQLWENEAGWLFYDGNYDSRLMAILAERFINEFAKVTTPFGNAFTHNPYHLFRYHYEDDKGKHYIHGVVYENGAVVLDIVDGITCVYIWIARFTVDTFNIPEPQALYDALASDPATPNDLATPIY